MITRSRTTLFLSYRNSINHSSINNYGNLNEEEQGLLTSNDDDNEDNNDNDNRNILPINWINTINEINSNLSIIENNLAKLDKLYSKRLLPRFSDRSNEEFEINNLTKDVTLSFKISKNYLNNFSYNGNSSDLSKFSNNFKLHFALKIKNLTSRFNGNQKVFLDKLKGHSVSDDFSRFGDNPLNVDNDFNGNDNSQLQLQQSNNDNDNSLEIQNISKSINELADLFNDLSNIVVDQGSSLDRIDFNVLGTHDQVSDSINELNQASKYQRSSSKIKLIILIILIILLIILLIIYRPFF